SEGLVALYFLETWRSSQSTEEALIGRIQPFNDILNRLRTQGLPIGIPLGAPSEFGNVRLEPSLAEIATEASVVAPLHGQGVIPDHACNIAELMQRLIALVAAVEPILIRSPHVEVHCWHKSSIAQAGRGC